MNQQQDTAGTSADSFSEDRSVKNELAASKGKMAELAETATAAGKAQLDSGIAQAAGQVDHIAKALDDAASRLKEDNQDGVAAYASHVASSITSLADRLRQSSVDELARDARQLARSNPALFLMGSVAVGFGLTRFLKASSRGADDSSRSSSDLSHTDPFGSTYGDSRDSRDTFGTGSDSRWDQGADTGRQAGAGDSLGDLGSRPMFPEMNTPAAGASGNVVGGTRTNELSGGSHG